MVCVFTYSGLLLDLLIVPFLVFKKTRFLAFFVIASFYLMNAQLFKIGIFPWFMIVATAIFFPPENFDFGKELKFKNPYHLKCQNEFYMD